MYRMFRHVTTMSAKYLYTSGMNFRHVLLWVQRIGREYAMTEWTGASGLGIGTMYIVSLHERTGLTIRV